ncbi:hypothetical protein E2C01_055320 [Portunus trituberculatus]|uniref:Uncharacterized protein n=1 Tax=Portunus trituberculatus TaxID=210409 RepID=A0A5B7GQV5_PORTR|nr:hypothetical protein [Portunus trituberculatus]
MEKNKISKRKRRSTSALVAAARTRRQAALGWRRGGDHTNKQTNKQTPGPGRCGREAQVTPSTPVAGLTSAYKGAVCVCVCGQRSAVFGLPP